MGLQWLENFIPYPSEKWLPVFSGVGVGSLVFVVTVHFVHRYRVPLLNYVMLRRPVAPAPITEAILDEPIEQLPLVYLPTSPEESAYLKTGRERRATIRYWGNPVEVGILSGYQVEPARGTVVNRSAGGVALLVDEAYEDGAALKVRAVLAPKEVGWIDVVVRNSRKAGKNWVIGCQYPQEPPWNAVVWLG
ncbi:MAG: hypothetical protein ACJ8FY_17740 [Gemmataceae bacterium]